MKKLLDLSVSFFILLAIAPILLVISLLIFLIDGSPIIFKQKRSGLQAKVFTLFKFKTMNNNVDPNNKLLDDSKRLTKLGNILRKTSLDELPSLWNVLKGDMSLVGPRPLLVDYIKLYNSDQARRLEVKPGITGWAQINGRNGISWGKKFKLDVWYVDNISFFLDIKILLLTIFKVLKSENINQSDNATMPRFTGKN